MTVAEPDPDLRVVALGREVERIARHQAHLDRHQADLDGLVRQLAEDLALLTPPPDGQEEPEALRSWLAAHDPEQARTLLADLAEWVGAVYLRYPDAALPSCWAWHPTVVEELWWLRNAHHDAYQGHGASWRDVGDWHDRQRPGVARRIHKAIGDCELPRHAPGGDRQHPTPAAPLAAHLDALAQHWTTHRSTPQPTEGQLTEAEHHDSSQHRRTSTR